MIKPKIIMLTSPDIHNMESGEPDNSYNFCVLIQALIGVENEEGAETFSFLVCTPNALEQRIPEGSALLARSYIFVKKYDYKLIWKTIQDICDKACMVDDWDQFAQIMTRYSNWEYENQ